MEGDRRPKSTVGGGGQEKSTVGGGGQETKEYRRWRGTVDQRVP